MNYLCTWMYSVPEGNKVVHSQTGKHSDTEDVQNIYWRCVFSLFHSSFKLHGASVRHCLFLNKMPPAYIDGISTLGLIKSLAIRVIELPQCTVAPTGFSSAWGTQFIIIDIVEWLMANVTDEDAVMVLDSDCLFTEPLGSALTNALQSYGYLLYTMHFPKDEKINGYTLSELQGVHTEVSGGESNNYFYTGGEFFCASGAELKQIAPALRKLWDQNLDRFHQGKSYFLEEAQLLSSVYAQLNYTHASANDLIRRIWTDYIRYVDVQQGDYKLPIWHLPLEKRRGFLKFWNTIVVRDQPMPDKQELRMMFRVHRGLMCKLLGPIRFLYRYYSAIRRSLGQ